MMKLTAQLQAERFSWLFLQTWRKKMISKLDTYILSKKKAKEKPKQIKPSRESSCAGCRRPAIGSRGHRCGLSGKRTGSVTCSMQPVSRDHREGSCSDTAMVPLKEHSKKGIKNQEQREKLENKKEQETAEVSVKLEELGTHWWSRNPKHLHWSRFILKGLTNYLTSLVTFYDPVVAMVEKTGPISDQQMSPI